MRKVFCACVLVLFFVSVLKAQDAWTEQMFLNNNAATDAELDDLPRIATDGNGVWVTVWTSEEDLNGAGSDSDILVARSLDNGQTWSDPAVLNTNATVDTGFDTQCTVAFGMNKFIAVWVSNENLNGTAGTDGDLFISVSTDFGITWSSPQVLYAEATTDSQFDWEPFLATNGLGNWIVAWYTNENMDGSGTDTDIFITTSANNGATWSSPAVLTSFMRSDSGNDFSPRLASDGAGVWGLVFDSPNSLNDTIGTDSDVLFVRSLDNGFSWSDPVAINSNAATDSDIDDEQFIAADGLGNWMIVWNSDDEDIAGIDWDIMVSHSSDGGLTWSSQASINGDDDTGSDYSPVLATDGSGTWTAVWENQVAELDIFSAYSTDGGQTWSPTIDLRMDTLSDGTNDKVPQVACDRQGNLVAVWQGAIQPDGGSDFDILVTSSLAEPPCQLSQTFFDMLPDWPLNPVTVLVLTINEECLP